MIYEMRTYVVEPGSVLELEKRIGEVLPDRQQYSKMAALWHTDIGPLNQVIHVWPYEDLEERARIRAEASKGGKWPPKVNDLLVSMDTQILLPAPFMRPMEPQTLGPLYELRIYTYKAGSIPEVIKIWADAVPHREKYSPLAACWYSDLGALNKWYHLWPYKDMAERDRVRTEARKDPHWPPLTFEYMVSQENKLLMPAECSPLQ